MNVAENLNRIIQAKADLKSVINSINPSIRKEELKDYVTSLAKMFGLSRVVFVDYDGTILKDEYCFVGDDLVPPVVPDHTDEGLVFTEWNWDTSVEKVGPVMMVIGACYTTVDGMNHIHIRLTTDLVFSISATFLTTAGNTPFSYTIYWGDDSEPETYTANGSRTHTYSQSGDYVIKLAITMPDTNSFYVNGNGTFPKTVPIKKLYFADRLRTYEGDYSKLVRLVLPSQMLSSMTIGNNTNLKCIVIPRNVTTVNYLYGIRLETVSIPKSITVFNGAQAYPMRLIGLSHLTKPLFSEVSYLNNIVSTTYYLQFTEFKSAMYAGNRYLTNINLSIYTTNHNSLPSSMFKDCINLESIIYFISSTYANTVPTSFAQNCFNLETIVGLRHVTKLSYYAFQNCFKLQLDISQLLSLITIEPYAFKNCSNLAPDVIIPDTVTTIKEFAFSGSNIRSFIMSDNSALNSIETSAFANMPDLESIEIRYRNNAMASISISNAPKLTSVIIHEGFKNSPIVKNAVSLVEITLPNSVEYICSDAFNGCTKLASINIPSNLKVIYNNAFYNCISLSMPIVLPESLTSLSQYAFAGCLNIPSIQLPSALVLQSYANNIFQDCKSLTSMIIPNTTKVFGNYLFSGCDNLASIVLGNAMTSIGTYTFKNCISLVIASVPATVTHIGAHVFNGCIAMTSFEIPPLETNIDNSVFNGCTNLLYIDFKNCSITSIKDKAFYNTGINGVLVLDFSNYSTVPTLSYSASSVFGRITGFEIRVPLALETAWKAATNWVTISACIIGV